MDRKSKGAVYHGECLPFMDGGVQANAPESSNGEYGKWWCQTELKILHGGQAKVYFQQRLC